MAELIFLLFHGILVLVSQNYYSQHSMRLCDRLRVLGDSWLIAGEVEDICATRRSFTVESRQKVKWSNLLY
ncbi:hypothetical protein [Nostoc sp. C117]|uniref:hypothetical protein n=1 Tax=Nostoc sp. C117 TaxID=3349875 RepID=UPI00370D8A36